MVKCYIKLSLYIVQFLMEENIDGFGAKLVIHFPFNPFQASDAVSQYFLHQKLCYTVTYYKQ